MAIDKTLAPVKFNLPAGIGDVSWIYSKLVTLNRKLHLSVADGRTAHDRKGRCLPLLGLLPNVTKKSAGEYHTKEVLEDPDQVRAMTADILAKAEEAPLSLQANKHLNAGGNLVDWMPELEVDYHYEMKRPKKYKDAAAEIEAGDGHLLDGRPYFTFYAASKTGNKKWEGWSAEQWYSMMARCSAEFGTETIALVGAAYDKDMADEIQAVHDRKNEVQLVNLVGETELPTTLEVVRGAQYSVCYPSGIPIMAHVMECPVMMFYPKHLSKLQTAWADPVYVENHRYKGCQFCSVDQAFGWLQEVRPMEKN
jgi:ADP-heptose:LPS heptosyltransferase